MRNGLNWVVLLVVILALVVGCAGPVSPTTEKATVKETGPIKIGIVANMSSAVGKSALASAEMAADEINAAGGVSGRKIEILSGDSQMQVPQAVAAYKKLVMVDKVSAVIAAESTELVNAMQETGAELYPEYPHICTAPGTSGLTQTDKVFENYNKYKFFFRTFADPISRALGGLAIANDVVKPMGIKKVAILEDDLDWTKIYRDGFDNPKTFAASPDFKALGDKVLNRDCSKGLPPTRDMWKALGVEVVYESKVPVGEKMFLPVFESIASSGAQYIDGWALAYIDSITMTKQWAESAAKDIPLFISGGAIQMPGAWGSTGGSILGLMVAMPSIEMAVSPMTIPYARNIKQKTGTGSTWMGQGSYDNVYLLATSIKKDDGDTKDFEKWIKTLETIDIDSTTGRVAFNAKCHQAYVGSGYYEIPICQWQGENNIKLLWPSKVVEMNPTLKGQYIMPKELRAKK